MWMSELFVAKKLRYFEKYCIIATDKGERVTFVQTAGVICGHWTTPIVTISCYLTCPFTSFNIF